MPKSFRILLSFLFCLLTCCMNTGVAGLYTSGSSCSAGFAQLAQLRASENGQPFDGSALYAAAYQMVEACNVGLSDAATRAAWRAQWQNRFAPSQLQTPMQAEQAINQMLGSLSQQWNWLERPAPAPTTPVYGSMVPPAPSEAGIYDRQPAASNDVVHSWQLSPGVLWIKIDRFADGTADQVRNALSAGRNSRAVILDLRGNRGGNSMDAIRVAAMLVPSGQLELLYDRDGDRIVSKSYSVSGEWITYSDSTNQWQYERRELLVAPGTPIIVLVDGQTASASEVVAGALQERGILIGNTTYGKNYGGEFVELPWGYRMFVATFEFLPRGVRMYGGIQPRITTMSPVETAAEVLRDSFGINIDWHGQ